MCGNVGGMEPVDGRRPRQDFLSQNANRTSVARTQTSFVPPISISSLIAVHRRHQFSHFLLHDLRVSSRSDTDPEASISGLASGSNTE